jgi:hypothetical protein
VGAAQPRAVVLAAPGAGAVRPCPVLLLELLWRCGHDPARRAAWRALSAQAIESGNPALDYIGIGGPTPLRAPA